MGYYINPAAFSAVFTVPAEVADRHLKLAKGGHIKALLYIMRNMSSGIDAAVLADKCGITEYEANEALLYWSDAGILIPDNPQPAADTVSIPRSSQSTAGDSINLIFALLCSAAYCTIIRIRETSIP